jgi:predicted transcriptional regulator
MCNDAVKPYRRTGVLSTELVDELVIYDPITYKVASLNGSARAIWQLCDGTRTVDQICEELGQRYSISPGTVRKEIAANVAFLLQLGMLSK